MLRSNVRTIVLDLQSGMVVPVGWVMNPVRVVAIRKMLKTSIIRP